MFPKKANEIFGSLQIDKKHLLQDISLELFLIAEIRLVAHPSLTDDDAVSCHLLQRRVLRLGFLDHTCLLVAMFECINSQQLLLSESTLKAVHSAKYVIMAVNG